MGETIPIDLLDLSTIPSLFLPEGEDTRDRKENENCEIWTDIPLDDVKESTRKEKKKMKNKKTSVKKISTLKQLFKRKTKKIDCDEDVGTYVNIDDMISALETGDFEFFKRYSGRFIREWNMLTKLVIRLGNLEVFEFCLQLALENNLPYWRSFIYCAAKHGEETILVRILNITTLPKEAIYDVCDGAAAGGQIAILQWAHEQGYAWHTGTTEEALKNRHFDVFLWLLYNKCPYDPLECLKIIEPLDREFYKWAKQNLQRCKKIIK